MNRHGVRHLLVGILLIGPSAMADEWGTWNDLPDNLLESEQDVRTLDELSDQLDQLIQANRDVDDSLRQQLLRHWLDQINTGANRDISLDRLIEMSADWENDELAEWYDDLEDYLEEQTTPIDPNGEPVDELPDDEDDDTGGSSGEDDLEDDLDDDSFDDDTGSDDDDGTEIEGESDLES